MMPATNGDYWWSGRFGTHFWVSPSKQTVVVVMQQRPREGDVLLHLPYEAFTTVTDFINMAARDRQADVVMPAVGKQGFAREQCAHTGLSKLYIQVSAWYRAMQWTSYSQTRGWRRWPATITA